MSTTSMNEVHKPLQVGGGLRDWVNRLFFLLIFASEASAWVRVASGHATVKAGAQASAFSSGNGDPVLFALNAFVLLVTAIICFPKTRTLIAILLNEKALLAIYGYSVLSILWSANPGNSFRTAVYLVAGLIEFTYVGFFMDVEDQVSTLGNIISFLGVLSFAGQFLLPASGDPAPGWTGIFPSKNYLGNVIAIGLLALLLERKPWNAFRISKVLICVSLLLLSQSFTSVLCVAVCGLLIAYSRLNRNSRILLVGVSVSMAILIAIVLPNFVVLLLGASGKNTTLTGRDVIWAFALKFISYRPFFGYGYYGFWISENDAALQYLGWNPNQAHNGYLDLVLNEGLVGLGILFTVFIVGFRRGWRQLRRGDPSGAGLWQFIMLIYLLVHNVSEADFYQRPAWVVYLIAYIASAKVDLPVVQAASEIHDSDEHAWLSDGAQPEPAWSGGAQPWMTQGVEG